MAFTWTCKCLKQLSYYTHFIKRNAYANGRTFNTWAKLETSLLILNKTRLTKFGFKAKTFIFRQNFSEVFLTGHLLNISACQLSVISLASIISFPRDPIFISDNKLGLFDSIAAWLSPTVRHQLGLVFFGSQAKFGL